VVSLPSGGGDLSALSCVSSTDCWAVGGVYVPGNGSSQGLLIEHYSGASWVTVNGPALSWETGEGPIVLNGVTCVGADDCWAVGENRDQMLIAQYSGDAWNAVSAPAASRHSTRWPA
jgi:hypothetical protein